MNVLIVGYGKMGRLIDTLAAEQGIEVAGRVDEGRDEWRAADVAIDFTTADVRNLAARYNLDVFVDRADRQFDFPILYRNDGFIAYDLR